MRRLLLAIAIAATTTATLASPWKSGEEQIDGGEDSLYWAEQWAESGGAYRLGYDCTYSSGVDTFFIETPDAYDPTTSYAPEVPTTFFVMGQTIEVNGVFQDRGGQLYVVYESFAIEGFGPLFDWMVVADSPIRVIFFDRDLSFSAEGIADALKPIYEECVFSY